LPAAAWRPASILFPRWPFWPYGQVATIRRSQRINECEYFYHTGIEQAISLLEMKDNCGRIGEGDKCCEL
jgi:hypothetical protein